mmetsp:Transcript_50830/g.99401  ORF Transcript_50830/g.99401 Transcript_50830/m.99401 type:complete len:443 (+) Transcript_50830:101-1429(+)
MPSTTYKSGDLASLFGGDSSAPDALFSTPAPLEFPPAPPLAPRAPPDGDTPGPAGGADLPDPPPDDVNAPLVRTSKRNAKKRRMAVPGPAAASPRLPSDGGTAAAPPPAPTPRAADPASSRTVFVGNLPPGTDRRSLAALFRTVEGSVLKVESTRIRSVPAAGMKVAPADAGNKNLVRRVCAIRGEGIDEEARGGAIQGYVVFATEEDAAAALAKDGTTEGGQILRVDAAEGTALDPARTVFVGNLPYRTGDDALRKHFDERLAEFTASDGGDTTPSAVSAVRVLRDRETCQCRGIAYVMLRDRTTAAEALKMMDGTTFGKREIRVRVCGKRRRERKEGPQNAPADRNGFGASRRIAGRNDMEGGARKDGKRAPSPAAPGQGKKRRRGALPSERNRSVSAPGKKKGPPGKSKRAAAEAKTKKRTKKLEKRIRTGMGQNKKKG